MAATNTPTTLASRLKEQYNDKISNLVPNSAILMGKLQFREDLSPGSKAVFDVQLSHENGFSVGSGVITLNDAVAQSSARAEVEGYQVILRSRVSYDAITRANSSKQAFVAFGNNKYIPMFESFKKREELLALYGRDSLAEVDSVSGQVITLKAGSFAPAIWLGAEGAVIEAFTAKTGGSQHNTDLTIASVSVSAGTLTVTGTCSSVENGDFLFFKSHRGAEPYGLMAIARNTGSLYNISATTYALWSANAYDLGTSGLTLEKVLKMAGVAGDKGCDEDLLMLVPIKAFQAIVSDQAALRDHGADYSPDKMENGAGRISFYGATGKIEIVPHPMMKRGECVMFPVRWTYLIGSSKMTQRINDRSGDMFFDLESYSAVEMRIYAEWTVFCEKPGWIVYGTRSDGAVLD